MLIVTRETITNAAVLETRSLPKKFFGRVTLIPRGAGPGLWARLILEMQFVRYMVALVPFIAIPFFATDLALPVTQAPIAMVLVIAAIELKVLRLSERARQRLMSEDEAARIVDAFTFRARQALRRIAARRGMAAGELALVLEQSELARVTPLTLVSVQSPSPAPHVLDLDAAERAILEEVLFDAELTERMLHAANLREARNIREVKVAAESVSAHARLAAWLDRRPEPVAEGA
ncbi:MAG: hypothetical protein ACOCY0_02755 [Roseicyclus sp.]